MLIKSYVPNDIVKVIVGGKVVLGRVVSSTDTEVEIYRANGNICYSLEEYEIENLGSCTI